MRSSVTVMFSNPPPDTTMNYPDYRQKAEDHGCFLILVKSIGQQMPPKSFNLIFDRISRLQHIKIPESQTGGHRGVWVRYKKSYALENNEWGDFQAHRKVLGLICIGKCSKQDELDLLCKEHEAVREKYLTTLFDSRCIVFGGSGGDSTRASPQHSRTMPLNERDLLQRPSTPKRGSAASRSDAGAHNGVVEEVAGEEEEEEDAASIDRDSGVFDAHAADVNATESPRVLSPLDRRLMTSTVMGRRPSALSRSSPVPSSDDDAQSLTFLAPAIPSPTSPCSPPSSSSVVSSAQPTPLTSPGTPGGDPSPTADDHSSGGSSSTTATSQRSDASSDSSSHLPRPTFLPPQNLKTTLLCYASQQDCAQLEQDLYDFVCSLFWVLESKRLDRSHDKLDRSPLLCAPFERKDFVGLDMESRANKKRCVGRMKKHIGDLCLLAGLPSESISYYNAAIDYLKSANDWLWLAGCHEGLCCASVLLLYPQNRWSSSIQRNSSFTAGAIPSFNARLKPGGFSSLPNGLDPAECKNKAGLSPAEVIEKYLEAISHYRKYHSAAVIETEACIKACRVLIHQEKYLQASDFLQNVVFINLQMSEEEKIRRFSELSLLYKQLGFHRKAAFFKRVAAMRCVTPQLADPNWSECYHLLLQTLDGYKLTLDPKLVPKGITYGWPVIQIQILQELVATSRRMGNTALSVRHMTFLLHTMFDNLTPTDRKEFATQLESLTARCEGAPFPLSLDNGTIIPPVNLINLPQVMSFKLQCLAPHLQPMRITPTVVENACSGPFIFSPLQFSSPKDKNKNTSKMDFLWVEGDVCAVSLQVFNPLPFEMKVTNMGLLPDGIAFETFPACLDLPPESGPFPVNLLGTPRSTGKLVILGYTTHVLGVKSNCRLKDIPCVKKPFFVVDVVPALPQVQVVTSLPKSPLSVPSTDSNSIVTSAKLSLFAGESCECTVSLLNMGKEDVESIEIVLESQLDKEQEKDFCNWSIENVMTLLPITPSNSASFTVYLHAVSDFLGNSKHSSDDCSVSETNSVSSTPSKSKTARTSSLSSFGSSRSSFAYSSLRGRLPELFATPVLPPPSLPAHPSKTIDAVIKLRYSGGPGLMAGYCRQCAVSVNVEVIPSIIITKWDVLPAEAPSHCYLVLDMLNTTDHEMEVQYAINKRILIEANDSCRIPISVQRCPLSKLAGLSNDEIEKMCRQHVAALVDLCWTTPATETSGKASISSLLWSSKMLDVIKMCPLQWEVNLNDHTFKPEDELTFPAGEMVDVVIIVFNYSDCAMTDLCLTVHCYQDYQNGQVASRMDGKLVIIGCDKVYIAQIDVQDSYRHQCGVVFYYPGIYKLDVQCRGQDVKGATTHAAGAAGENRAWRCTPPIEINVT